MSDPVTQEVINRRAYYKAWRDSHRDQIKAYQERYWTKRAAKKQEVQPMQIEQPMRTTELAELLRISYPTARKIVLEHGVKIGGRTYITRSKVKELLAGKTA